MKSGLYNMLLWIAFLSSPCVYPAQMPKTRIKELVTVRGMRENDLIGFGVVVGLNGTGDTEGSPSTKKATRILLEKLGVSPTEGEERLFNNFAGVVVTAKLPAFAQPGTRIDVRLSAAGTATSLAGGTLVSTPLKAGDGKIYAVAQGSVVTGRTVGTTAPVLTVARVPEGGTIERKFVPKFVHQGTVQLFLKRADFTTASRIVDGINGHFRGFIASSKDARSIEVALSSRALRDPVSFLSAIEGIIVESDLPAKVVVNERTGTIVLGGNVQISPVTIAHRDLTIEVRSENAPPRSESIVPLQTATIGSLVDSLNQLGVKSEDLVSILQSLRVAGALNAALEFI
ncbi:MAG: flagellar basal body P-ring protein FlgI [Zetaproteobacteria bacterium]|nr:flagellar basal body P-ring protein FlgI [Zetaproteobacteria bacterium]